MSDEPNWRQGKLLYPTTEASDSRLHPNSPPPDAYDQYCAAQTSPPPLDPEQTHRLLAAAERAIRQTLDDGKAKYQPGEWLKHTVTEHLIHGGEHAMSQPFEKSEDEEDGRHLRHAVTRLCMALALLDA